jgi:putative phosphoesterase
MSAMPSLGVISDTHGLLRPEAVNALRGVDHIVHAGDIGRKAIIDELSAIAPVTAIRGNVDRTPDVACFPATATVAVGGWRVHLVHAIEDLALDPKQEGIDAVVYGHSHKPVAHSADGVLWLNPGSAGPRRFRRPVTLATVAVGASGLVPRIRELDV